MRNLSKLFTGHTDTRGVVDYTEFYIDNPTSPSTMFDMVRVQTFKQLENINRCGTKWNGNIGV